MIHDISMRCLVAMVAVTVAFGAPAARADIYEWEWVDPGDPSQGKQESTILCPDGAGVDAVPHAELAWRDLTKAYLIGRDLTEAVLEATNLTNADLSHATLTGASLVYFDIHELTSANFTNATLRHANLEWVNCYEVSFNYADLSYALLSGAYITGYLIDANLTGAVVTNTIFNNPWGLTKEQIYTTASYQQGDLHGIALRGVKLFSANFAGQNLTDADLTDASLYHADFTGATVRGASFQNTSNWGVGFQKEQLYSTASYQAGDLHGVNLAENIMTGWDLSGQNLVESQFTESDLTGANLSRANLTQASLSYFQTSQFAPKLNDADLSEANLTNANLRYARLRGADATDALFTGAQTANADFSLADCRGAQDLSLSSAIKNDTIMPNGFIYGLSLENGETLPVRDYEGGIGIAVANSMSMASGSTLRVLLEDDSWGSRMTLTGGFTADLGGTLELAFAPGTDPAALVGLTFQLLYWNNCLVTGDYFDQVLVMPDHQWDLSELYTTGEVTLLGIPEPASAALLLLGGAVLLRRKP